MDEHSPAQPNPAAAPARKPATASPAHHGGVLALSLAALGVVYGDIGTSPLYAFKVAVQASQGVTMGSATASLGLASLIIWSLIVVVSLKYAILILRADNQGEGGVVAMLALLDARIAKPGTWQGALLVVGLIGAALLYGDGAITPAISVLSAVEGLEVDAPSLTRLVLPITIAILIALFWLQSYGTGVIGRIFGPVMLCWFAAIAAMGVRGIAAHPAILGALLPFPALAFLAHAPLGVSFVLCSVENLQPWEKAHLNGLQGEGNHARDDRLRRKAHTCIAPAGLDKMSYYLGHETVVSSRLVKGMAPWREEIFVAMQRSTSSNGATLHIPSNQIVEVGMEIVI